MNPQFEERRAKFLALRQRRKGPYRSSPPGRAWILPLKSVPSAAGR